MDQQRCGILSLPLEVLTCIVTPLGMGDYLRLSLTCLFARNLLVKDALLWKAHLRARDCKVFGRTLNLFNPVSDVMLLRESPHLLFAYHKTSIDRHIDLLVTSCLAVQERLMTSVSLDERNRCVSTHKVFGGRATNAAATNQPKTRKRKRTDAPVKRKKKKNDTDGAARSEIVRPPPEVWTGLATTVRTLRIVLVEAVARALLHANGPLLAYCASAVTYLTEITCRAYGLHEPSIGSAIVADPCPKGHNDDICTSAVATAPPSPPPPFAATACCHSAQWQCRLRAASKSNLVEFPETGHGLDDCRAHHASDETRMQVLDSSENRQCARDSIRECSLWALSLRTTRRALASKPDETFLFGVSRSVEPLARLSENRVEFDMWVPLSWLAAIAHYHPAAGATAVVVYDTMRTGFSTSGASSSSRRFKSLLLPSRRPW